MLMSYKNKNESPFFLCENESLSYTIVMVFGGKLGQICLKMAFLGRSTKTWWVFVDLPNLNFCQEPLKNSFDPNYDLDL